MPMGRSDWWEACGSFGAVTWFGRWMNQEPTRERLQRGKAQGKAERCRAQGSKHPAQEVALPHSPTLTQRLRLQQPPPAELSASVFGLRLGLGESSRRCAHYPGALGH